MADRPEAEQITTSERTSALVAGGMVVLAVLGVFTVFSDVIAAAWSPPAAAASGSTASASIASPSPSASPAPASGDGGPA